MEQEAAFLDALDETAPILTNLLAEEALRQDYLPGPGEHAPAAWKDSVQLESHLHKL